MILIRYRRTGQKKAISLFETAFEEINPVPGLEFLKHFYMRKNLLYGNKQWFEKGFFKPGPAHKLVAINS